MNDEERIRKAAADGRIVMAETDNIESYDAIAEGFLRKICNIDYKECFISDESTLSDFAGCCIDNDTDVSKLSLSEFYDLGKKNIVERVNNVYGLEVDVYDTLVNIIEKIYDQKKIRVN